MALNKLTPTTEESGRGGVGMIPPRGGQSAPPGGIFKGGYAPLKWSFASFSSNKKRKGRGVLGARPERPLSPGPARFDRSKARNGKFHILRCGLSRPRRRDLQGLKNIRAGVWGYPKNWEAESFKNFLCACVYRIPQTLYHR